jgi:hypothetical protein
MRVVKNGFCKKPRQNVNFRARLEINNSLRRVVWSKQSVLRFGLLILSVTVGLMRFGNLLTEKLTSKKKKENPKKSNDFDFFKIRSSFNSETAVSFVPGDTYGGSE